MAILMQRREAAASGLALSLLVLCLSLAVANVANAEDMAYPSRTVKIVVPYAPGSAPDAIARVVGQRLNESTHQSVVVDNRAGGAGVLAADLVAKAPPDGYTLMLADQQQWGISPALFKKLPYDPVKDFAPISVLGTTPLFLTLAANFEAADFKAFVALVKANPGKYNYGTPGVGSIHHMIAESLKAQAGLDLVHVPYKGGALVVQALLVGDIAVAFQALPALLASLDQGKVKLLAVATAERDTAGAPNVPTFKELGVPGMEFPGSMGIVAPAGTPAPVIAFLSAEMKKAVHHPDTIDRFAKLNIWPVGNTPDEFAAVIRSDLAKFAKSAKSAGIEPE